MNKADKAAVVEALKEKLDTTSYFYITDASTLTVEQVNKFRRLCFEKGIEMKVVKNTLAIKAMESFPAEKRYAPVYDLLKGHTALLFTTNANAPAKVLKEFRKTNERPLLKGAYIDTDVFVGDDQLDALTTLKSKEDLIGDIIGLLQSPAKNVISALKSGGTTIAGLVKTLQERGE